MNRWLAPLSLSLGLLLIGAVWLRGQGAAAPEANKKEDKEPRTVVTTGTAKVRAKSDSARVFGSVETIAPQVKEGREDCNTRVHRMTAALKALKLDSIKMKTGDVNIAPQIDRSKENAPPKITGYQVSYDFTVLIENEDTDKLNANTGKVLDAVLENGANKVERVVFFKKDESGIQREARTKAVEDAIANAKALLKGANMVRYQVTQIHDAPASSPWGSPFAAQVQNINPFNPGNAGAQGNDETRIMAGDVEVSSTITITCTFE
jgi:uncharacterized protein YggE